MCNEKLQGVDGDLHDTSDDGAKETDKSGDVFERS